MGGGLGTLLGGGRRIEIQRKGEGKIIKERRKGKSRKHKKSKKPVRSHNTKQEKERKLLKGSRSGKYLKS